jgi:DNA-binding CsgD family transcriptional regulator
MSAALGTWLKNNGDFDEGRRWLERTRQAAIDEGDEGSLPFALSHLPQLELWAGRWQEAEDRAAEHLELAERTGQSLERFTAIFSLATVDAHRGRLDRARSRLLPALAEAEKGDRWSVYQLLSALGFVELSSGRYDDAVRTLGRAFDIYESTGAADTPGVFESYAEALVRVGDLDRAREIVDLYEQRARVMDRALAIAPALRCRALVAEAQGELERAADLLREALSHHDQVAMPFSRARTELVLGRVERRRGERRAARQALEAAVATFTALGAPLWAELATKELGRVPIRRRAAEDSLTPTETRVAELVSEGLTNRQIAQTLFVTDKTVEANLTRIYRKLGVRSRTELATRPVPKA